MSRNAGEVHYASGMLHQLVIAHAAPSGLIDEQLEQFPGAERFVNASVSQFQLVPGLEILCLHELLCACE